MGELETETRRAALIRCGRSAAAGVLSPVVLPVRRRVVGAIVGEPTGARIGNEVLSAGGNVVDGIVAAAFAAAVAAPHQTGFGGYGGCLTLALAGTGECVSIDFNSAAPAAAQPDMFLPGPDGKVPMDRNSAGWLAAGVPGILAGLALAIDRFGTRSFAELVEPAIQLAQDGIIVDAAVAGAVRAHAAILESNKATKELFFINDRPVATGDRLTNRPLADLLRTLAARNSVDSFYRGDIAQQIADAFARHGGLVTASDLANYRPIETEPITATLGEYELFTAPPAAGGLTVLQTLMSLHEGGWHRRAPGVARTHALIESLRIAWHDRLNLLADPRHVDVPIDRLLSVEHARAAAARVESAVASRRPLELAAPPNPQGGTISLSGADSNGNLIALTFTHGEAFGSKVAVDGLGLVLGHGMSRFDPRPDRPNSPGPGKRPLHNMSPTIVKRLGVPVLAAGARGGRRIPNALLCMLSHFVLLGRTMDESIAAARLHTEGARAIEFEKSWPTQELAELAEVGFQIKTVGSAIISSASFDPATGAIRTAMR